MTKKRFSKDIGTIQERSRVESGPSSVCRRSATIQSFDARSHHPVVLNSPRKQERFKTRDIRVSTSFRQKRTPGVETMTYRRSVSFRDETTLQREFFRFWVVPF